MPLMKKSTPIKEFVSRSDVAYDQGVLQAQGHLPVPGQGHRAHRLILPQKTDDPREDAQCWEEDRMGERILIVDDEQAIVDVLALYLENDGYTVDKCCTAAQARAWPGCSPPSCSYSDKSP